MKKTAIISVLAIGLLLSGCQSDKNEVEDTVAETSEATSVETVLETTASTTVATTVETTQETTPAVDVPEGEYDYYVTIEWTNSYGGALTPEIYGESPDGSAYVNAELVDSQVEEGHGIAEYRLTNCDGDFIIYAHCWGETPLDDVLYDGGTVTVYDRDGNVNTVDYEDWMWSRAPTGAHPYNVFCITEDGFAPAGALW